ncbi:MAG TPA: cbb3-type cytochrome oxidase assembly protein CcoS [Thermodesulfobacteriota bacterium]|nr:cbb3-type cytochrome oxidase assembly protein CcoS [Thermodesulfobacteriota bacterium]
MNILFLTLAISLVLALIFLVGFVWATRKGQYDDLTTPSQRMLIDDFETKKNHSNKEEKAHG